jgi:hypothetical protein
VGTVRKIKEMAMAANVILDKLQQTQANATVRTWEYFVAKRCAAQHVAKIKMHGFAKILIYIKSTFG